MQKLLSTTALILTLAVSGMAYADDKGPHHEGPPPFMDHAIEKLPKEDGDKFRAALAKAHEAEKPTMEKMHALHREIDALLKAPTFDKVAFLKKSEQMQQLVDKSHRDMTKAFADAVASLPQDERATLAEGMHPPHGHHGPHGDGPKDKDHGSDPDADHN